MAISCQLAMILLNGSIRGGHMQNPDKGTITPVKAKRASGRFEREARQARDWGRSFIKTSMGKTVLTGALAGAAIGAALPFISAIAGAALGAGSLVLIKSIKDKL